MENRCSLCFCDGFLKIDFLNDLIADIFDCRYKKAELYSIYSSLVSVHHLSFRKTETRSKLLIVLACPQRID